MIATITSFFKRLSISKKLAFWYGLSLFLMLSLFGYFLYEMFHQSVHRNYDRHLHFEAKQLLPFIAISGDTLSINLSGYSGNKALKSGVEYGTYVRLYNRSGKSIYQSPNFSDVDDSLSTVLPDVRVEQSVSTQWQTLPARTLFYPIKKKGTFYGWLEVTGFEWTQHAEIKRFRRYIIIFIALSVIFAIVGGYWLSKKALSPVSSIIEAAKSITAADMGKRIPVNYQVRDELTDMADTFNVMLNRLQNGFEREKRFTSDAAHELMTPLSSMRSDAEIMLRKPRSKEEYQQTIRRMLVEVGRMSEMVHLLLELSSVEAVHRPQLEVINISRIAEVVTAQHKEIAGNKNINLEVGIDPELYIRARGAYIEEIINNLLENGLKYTPQDGNVSLRLQRSGKKAVIHVTDSGIGFDQEVKKNLFERFYRANQAEVQERPGSGLGLSLVKAIVELYDGKVRACSGGSGEGSTFIVELPLVKETE